MTPTTQKEIVKRLFLKDSKLFFDKLESAPKKDNTNDPFIINGYTENKSDFGYFEFKDEFKDLLSNLSLAEIHQITQVNSHNEIKSIKGWVTFFGILVIIQIVVGVIAALVWMS